MTISMSQNCPSPGRDPQGACLCCIRTVSYDLQLCCGQHTMLTDNANLCQANGQGCFCLEHDMALPQEGEVVATLDARIKSGH